MSRLESMSDPLLAFHRALSFSNTMSGIYGVFGYGVCAAATANPVIGLAAAAALSHKVASNALLALMIENEYIDNTAIAFAADIVLSAALSVVAGTIVALAFSALVPEVIISISILSFGVSLLLSTIQLATWLDEWDQIEWKNYYNSKNSYNSYNSYTPPPPEPQKITQIEEKISAMKDLLPPCDPKWSEKLDQEIANFKAALTHDEKVAAQNKILRYSGMLFHSDRLGDDYKKIAHLYGELNTLIEELVK